MAARNATRGSASKSTSVGSAVGGAGSAAQANLGPLDPEVLVAKMYEDVKTEIAGIDPDSFDFKSPAFPLARIKKIMKLDPHIRLVAAEVPVFFSKACELMVREMALRGLAEAREHKRRMVSRADIAAALCRNEVFDFLIDIIPRDAFKTARYTGSDGDDAEGTGTEGDEGEGGEGASTKRRRRASSGGNANAVATSMFIGAPEVQMLMLQAAKAQAEQFAQAARQEAAARATGAASAPVPSSNPQSNPSSAAAASASVAV